MADTAVNKTLPLATESPVTADNYFRDLKAGLGERLDRDHDWMDGDLFKDGGGQHKKVSLPEQVADPTTVANEGYLYTKVVSAETELFWLTDDQGSARQLMTGNLINILYTDLVAAIDGTTLYSTGSAIAVWLDAVTLEYDATAKVQIKTPAVPSSGADAYPDAIASPVEAWGSYSGSESNQTIDAGITIRHLIIRNDVSGQSAIEAVINTAGQTAWRQATGDLDTDVTISGTTFIATGNSARVNDSGKTYYWHAIGTR